MTTTDPDAAVFEVGSGPAVATATFGTSFDALRERLDGPLVQAPF